MPGDLCCTRDRSQISRGLDAFSSSSMFSGLLGPTLFSYELWIWGIDKLLVYQSLVFLVAMSLLILCHMIEPTQEYGNLIVNFS